MVLRILLLAWAIAMAHPLRAEPVQGWLFEPGNEKRAASFLRKDDPYLTYGFSCWKNQWSFYYNYQAPEGGRCADQPSCESAVADVQLVFRVAGAAPHTSSFKLFENFYFQNTPLPDELFLAALKANAFALELDKKLQDVWERTDIAFSTLGLDDAVRGHSGLTCVSQPSASAAPTPAKPVPAPEAAPPRRIEKPAKTKQSAGLSKKRKAAARNIKKARTMKATARKRASRR